MSSFKLHHQLKNDLTMIKETKNYTFMTMDDKELPWLIIIPNIPNIIDIDHLTRIDRESLMELVSCASALIKETFKCDKINIGIFGNMVPQFHVHIIGRFKNDRKWPESVIGHQDIKLNNKHTDTLKELVGKL